MPPRTSSHATRMATAMPAAGGSRMARIPVTMRRTLSAMAQPTDCFTSPLTVEALMVLSCPGVIFGLREIELDACAVRIRMTIRRGGERRVLEADWRCPDESAGI